MIATQLEALEAKLGLPELEGTDRQIDWARKIRMQVYEPDLASYFRSETSAKFYIDYRGFTAYEMFKRNNGGIRL